MLRVKKISVKKLFGTFDYAIPLNMAERITILHGPNGFGKTTLLTMLSEVFNPYSQAIRKIPFQEFRVDFDNGSYIRIEKILQSDDLSEETNLKISFRTPKQKKEKSFSSHLDRKMAISNLDHEITWIDSDSPTTTHLIELRAGESLSFEKVLERHTDHLPPNLKGKLDTPAEWKELKAAAMIHFIETQRLLRHSSRRPRFNESSLMSPVAEIYAEELAREIEAKLAEYAAQSQTLDRTFPKRLLEHEPTSNLTNEELNRKLDALEEKRKRFTAAGFLDSSEEQMGMKISEDARSVLSVYVDDVEKKLSVLDGLANKVELFREIINKRFLYKEMTISKEKGFIFTTKNDSTLLAPKDLSSGEQHELVMFYEFLFKTKPGSLILIDEPEISLHVAWQVEFLRDIQEIIKLADFDVLLATHSPSLISNKWDLTVELKGTEQ